MRNLAISVIFVISFFNQTVFSAEFRFSPGENKAHLIQWRQWGKESLDEARKEDKLVLLSLSAVWCHWCHVMDETTYSDAAVIDYINRNFIPVRVDANMRPDVDSLYNQGGWPSTVILTPEGEIVQGGTYISRELMIEWLSTFAEMFAHNRKAVQERIDAMKKRREDGQIEFAAPGNPEIARIIRIIKSSYDRRYGGFGRSQKFPNPDAIDFLLSEYQRRQDPEMKEIISTTLENMSRGKIHDSVEGGFFRYSTMPDWSAPHYEKMLEVNAALVGNYSAAYMVFGNSSYKKVMNETMAYIEKYLYDGKQGVFFGSQDAEEAYYERTGRTGVRPPYVDRTVYADSNARMITALIAAHGATGKEKYLAMARKAADFIIKEIYSQDDGVYHHNSGGKRLSGLLADNALFGLALLDLYNVTGERRYLTLAEHIASLLAERFYDNKKKEFRPALDTTAVEPFAAGALWEYSAALANYRAVIFLSRLHYCNGSRDMKDLGDAVRATFRSTYERYAPSAALYGTALLWALKEPVVITVIAEAGKAGRFLRQLNKVYIPQKTVKILHPKQERDEIGRLGYPLQEAVYACSGKKCSPAFTRPEELISGIKRFVKTLGRGGEQNP